MVEVEALVVMVVPEVVEVIVVLGDLGTLLVHHLVKVIMEVMV